MRRHLVCTVMLLIFLQNLMTSVNGCDTKSRPSDPSNSCVGKVCVKGKCQDHPCTKCVSANWWCHGYCDM
uniref:Putative secreted salivary protein n=1 Tax=Amblyomma parvum TaxID=251391 RepID=A0A023FVR8_AMBPA